MRMKMTMRRMRGDRERVGRGEWKRRRWGKSRRDPEEQEGESLHGRAESVAPDGATRIGITHHWTSCFTHHWISCFYTNTVKTTSSTRRHSRRFLARKIGPTLAHISRISCKQDTPITEIATQVRSVRAHLCQDLPGHNNNLH